MNLKPTALKRRGRSLPSEANGSRTKLGGILRQIRGEIVASGVALLDWRQLDRELASRRGGAKGEARA